MQTVDTERLPLYLSVNGMAHAMLTVSRFEVARAFYRELLPHFGMKPVFEVNASSTALAAGPRSALNHAILHTTVNALFSGVSACTIFACVPARVKTWIGSRLCSGIWVRRSYANRKRVAGHRATTQCYTRTRMASAWNCVSCRALDCWRAANPSIPL
jgi:hypothetical protein